MDPTTSPAEAPYGKIAELVPQTDSRRSLQAQALNLVTDLARARMFLFTHRSISIPTPFLVVLVFWLTLIFISFGLFPPKNVTMATVFLVCALSIPGEIFLTLELDQSFTGLIQISGAPLRQDLAQIGP